MGTIAQVRAVPKGKYSPSNFTGAKKQVVSGRPDKKKVSTTGWGLVPVHHAEWPDWKAISRCPHGVRKRAKPPWHDLTESEPETNDIIFKNWQVMLVFQAISKGWENGLKCILSPARRPVSPRRHINAWDLRNRNILYIRLPVNFFLLALILCLYI